MKHFLILLTLSCLLFSPLRGISPPSPIQGTPNILTPKFSLTCGFTAFEIDIPAKWGLGNFPNSSEDTTYFDLYPRQGGNGCAITVKRYENGDQAMNALNKLRNRCDKTIDLPDGFETELSRAWFSCRANGQFLIKTWYSLPKKKSEHKNDWKNLKNCIRVSNVQTPIFYPSAAKNCGPIEEMMEGWKFKHPVIEQFVLFKMRSGVTLNKDDNFKYLISFSDSDKFADKFADKFPPFFNKSPHLKGYFYLKWDQTELDTANPYQNFADEIAQDIKAKHVKSIFDPMEIHLKEGVALIKGTPYAIFVFAGDNILFGFAIESFGMKGEDLNKLSEKIAWSIPQ